MIGGSCGAGFSLNTKLTKGTKKMDVERRAGMHTPGGSLDGAMRRQNWIARRRRDVVRTNRLSACSNVHLASWSS